MRKTSEVNKEVLLQIFNNETEIRYVMPNGQLLPQNIINIPKAAVKKEFFISELYGDFDTFLECYMENKKMHA